MARHNLDGELPPHLIPLLAIAATIDLPAARDILTAWPDDQRQAEIGRVTDDLAAKSAAIVNPGERPPRTPAEKAEYRQVWRALARAVALGSQTPGGMLLLGHRWTAVNEGVAVEKATR